MEALYPTMEEGRIVKWLKREGEPVKTGDTLAEVETDKAVMELVARADGVLRQVAASEGQTVPVGTVVAIIAGPGEVDVGATGAGRVAAPAAPPAGAPAPARRDERQEPATLLTPAARAAAPGAAATAARAAPAAPAAPADATRVKASPLARRIARETGVDLQLVTGSGPGGRVVRRDLDGASATTVGATAARGSSRLRRRSPHPDPEDDREAPRLLPRPYPPLLPHDRGGHGAGGRGARRPQPTAGRSGQGFLHRHHPQSDGPRAPQTPRVQRLVPGRPYSLLERGAHRHGRRAGRWAYHTGDSRCRREVARRDQSGGEGARRADPEPAPPAGRVHRVHVLGVEPGDVRHRSIHRGDQSSRSGDHRGGVDHATASGGGRSGRAAPPRTDHDELRSPGDRRRDGGGVPQDVEGDARRRVS